MAEKYRPSNGSDGDGFFAAWCCRCARDKSMSDGKDFDACTPEEICPIIADSLAFHIDHPKYPVEWIRDADGPKCTAFIPAGEPLPLPRCTLTPDMFEESKP